MSDDTTLVSASRDERLRVFWGMLVRQLFLLLLATCFVVWWQAKEQAQVVLVGGLIALIAQTLASIRGLIRIDHRSAQHLLMGVLRGEAVKWLVVITFFVLVFRIKPEWRTTALAVWLFAGFIVVQVIAWWSIAIQEAVRAAKTAHTIGDDQ